MATTKITDLTAYTDPVNTDVLPIVDVTSDVTKKVSIANVMKNASLGSASAPGVAFDGDPNTGIYSPGADQVAVSTGGTQRLLIDSSGAVTIAGDLTVNGTTTNINTQNLVVEDKNVVLGDVATPTDVTADGGGITLKGTTDKTINWVDATDAWTSSEHINIAAGKEYRIAGTKVLDATSLGSNVLITSANITDGTIVNADINAAAAIDKTKISGTAITAADTGTVTSTMIADGTILNADVNAAAAIAGTKISPDFGSQNVTTTGTSTAASFIPSSSTAPTNGVYLPAANTVGISTGGSGRLFVGSDGSVGIGAAAAATVPLDITDTGNGIRIKNAASGNYAIGLLAGTGSQDAYVFQRANAPLIFGTNNTERLRITSAGLVGVGTSSPAEQLELAKGSERLMIGADSPSGYSRIAARNTANSGYRGFQIDGSDLLINSNTNGNVLVATGGGRVGIGTSSPSFTAHVAGAKNTSQLFIDAPTISAANDFAQIGFGIGGTAFGLVRLGFDNPAGVTNSYLSFYNNSGSSTVERMRIDSSGRVGIGTTSPSEKVHIVGGALRVDGSFNVNGTSCIGFDQLSANNSAIRAWGSVGNTASIAFWTGSGGTGDSEKARIDSSGRLLVGTSSSFGNYQQQLGYNGGVINGVYVRSTASSGDGSVMLTFERASTPNNTVPVIAYVDLTATRFELRSNGGLANYQANNVNLSDRNAKKDISPAADTWNCIKEWEIVNYRYKDQPDDADLNLGVIAQQVAESCPEVITVFEEAKDDQPEKLGVKEQQMYWMAIKALQEAQVRIEALEAEVAALKAS